MISDPGSRSFAGRAQPSRLRFPLSATGQTAALSGRGHWTAAARAPGTTAGPAGPTVTGTVGLPVPGRSLRPESRRRGGTE